MEEHGVEESAVLNYLREQHGAQFIDFSSITSLVVLGSCRGLLLLATRLGSFILRNPSTGEHRRIPSSTSLSEIALSPDLAQEQLKSKPYSLREMRGCLGLCDFGYGGMTEIWIMKEYKVQSSWTKIVFSTHDNRTTHGFFPICFTKCGHVFGSDEFGRLLRLNDKGKLLAVWPGESKYRLSYSRTHMYTPSLLSLPS